MKFIKFSLLFIVGVAALSLDRPITVVTYTHYIPVYSKGPNVLHKLPVGSFGGPHQLIARPQIQPTGDLTSGSTNLRRGEHISNFGGQIGAGGPHHMIGQRPIPPTGTFTSGPLHPYGTFTSQSQGTYQGGVGHFDGSGGIAGQQHLFEPIRPTGAFTGQSLGTIAPQGGMGNFGGHVGIGSFNGQGQSMIHSICDLIAPQSLLSRIPHSNMMIFGPYTPVYSTLQSMIPALHNLRIGLSDPACRLIDVAIEQIKIILDRPNVPLELLVKVLISLEQIATFIGNPRLNGGFGNSNILQQKINHVIQLNERLIVQILTSLKVILERLTYGQTVHGNNSIYGQLLLIVNNLLARTRGGSMNGLYELPGNSFVAPDHHLNGGQFPGTSGGAIGIRNAGLIHQGGQLGIGGQHHLNGRPPIGPNGGFTSGMHQTGGSTKATLTRQGGVSNLGGYGGPVGPHQMAGISPIGPPRPYIGGSIRPTGGLINPIGGPIHPTRGPIHPTGGSIHHGVTSNIGLHGLPGGPIGYGQHHGPSMAASISYLLGPNTLIAPMFPYINAHMLGKGTEIRKILKLLKSLLQKLLEEIQKRAPKSGFSAFKGMEKDVEVLISRITLLLNKQDDSGALRPWLLGKFVVQMENMYQKAYELSIKAPEVKIIRKLMKSVNELMPIFKSLMREILLTLKHLLEKMIHDHSGNIDLLRQLLAIVNNLLDRLMSGHHGIGLSGGLGLGPKGAFIMSHGLHNNQNRSGHPMNSDQNLVPIGGNVQPKPDLRILNRSGGKGPIPTDVNKQEETKN